MALDRGWILRIIREEKPAAALLLIAGALGLIGANVAGEAATASILHAHVPVVGLDVAEFAAAGLLVIFFFVSGLELRHELTTGSLNSVRAAAVPVLAAASGMLVPALLFGAVAPETLRSAWGVPMATDLPLALALIAVAGSRLPIAFRAFILSLAIADDVGSIIVIAFAFGAKLSALWLVVTIALVAGYAIANRRDVPGWLQFAFAIAAWWSMLRTGIHPTVLGVALGIATSRNGERLREFWQPWSAAVAVPAFMLTSLAIVVEPGAFEPGLIGAVTLARIVGKPLGIVLGAALAIAVWRPAERLTWAQYLTAGSVSGLGFSVSTLFAELGLGRDHLLLVETKVAILVALGVAAVVATGAVRTMQAYGDHE